MMGFWTAVIVIVAIVMAADLIRQYQQKSVDRYQQQLADLSEKVERMEARMAVVEKLLIEQEKQRPFDQL